MTQDIVMPPAAWSCSACSLVNLPSRRICSRCKTPRPADPVLSAPLCPLVKAQAILNAPSGPHPSGCECPRCKYVGRDFKTRAPERRASDLRKPLVLLLASAALLVAWVAGTTVMGFKWSTTPAHGPYFQRTAIGPLLDACAAAHGAIELNYALTPEADVVSVTCRASKYAP